MPTYNYDSVIITDFTTGLHNNSINTAKVKDIMKKLHKFKGFSFIVPRKFVRFIVCDYYITREVKKEDGEQYEDDLMITSFPPKKE